MKIYKTICRLIKMYFSQASKKSNIRKCLPRKENTMEEVRKRLEEREKELKKLKKDKEKALKHAPEGSLRVNSYGGRTQYYHRINPKDLNGVYIKDKEVRLAQKLAQKDYDTKILRAAGKEIKAIQRYFSSSPVKYPEEIYGALHRERQKLVFPIKETDEEYIKAWESIEYEGKKFYEDTPELYTAKRERVRSKSEVIIADLLNKEGIPYRYEFPVELDNSGVIYPDFTVLNVRKRKEFLWEHFGMIDDSFYAENAVRKIITYGQNDFIQGKNLLLSYETKAKPLDPRQVLILIRTFLK